MPVMMSHFLSTITARRRSFVLSCLVLKLRFDISLRLTCGTWTVTSLSRQSSCPSCVIRAALGDAAITCTYALLAGKSREVYEEMLRGITRKCDALGYTADPRRIVVDYEQVRYGKVCELVENIGNCGYWMLSTFVLC